MVTDALMELTEFASWLYCSTRSGFVAVFRETGVCAGFPTVVWRTAHPEHTAVMVAAPRIQVRLGILGMSFVIGTNNLI
jgi:hypothetical protein